MMVPILVSRRGFLWRTLTASLVFACCLLSGLGEATAAPWKVGSAKVNITPEQSMWMSGYGGRNKPAEGKLTDLWAKTLVLEDAAQNRAVLVTLDLVGIDQGLSRRVTTALTRQYGLQRRQVAFCTSHTHTGPAVGRNLAPLHYLQVDQQQRKLIDQYTESLEKKLVAMVGQALQNMVPSRLAWGSGTATFAVNRRNNRPEADVPKRRAEGTLKGPFDHDVPVLAVRDASGQLTHVVFGYACHATVLSFYQWSGDYPGFAQMELERAHPGCLAMFWAGCGADQNPLPRRTVELAKDYGRQLAAAVQQVLDQPMNELQPQLNTQYHEVDLPLDQLPTREQIEEDTRSQNRYSRARAQMLLSEIDAGRPLSPTYPYPVGLWQLGGEIQFVILGGEVVVDYALRLKAELAGKKTWVAGYSNDVMAYIPSRRVLREGGYEGAGAMLYYGLPTTWAPQVEEVIIRQVKQNLAGPSKD